MYEDATPPLAQAGHGVFRHRKKVDFPIYSLSLGSPVHGDVGGTCGKEYSRPKVTIESFSISGASFQNNEIISGSQAQLLPISRSPLEDFIHNWFSELLLKLSP